MSMMASSSILLSSVQDHKNLGKRRIISYLLILVSPSPSMPAQTRLQSSYKLETKHCHSAPGASWLNLLCLKYSQLAEKVFPSILERQAPRSLMLLCNTEGNRAGGLGCHERLGETKGNALMYLCASPSRTNQ